MANFFDAIAESTTDLKEQVRLIVLRLNAIADPRNFVYAALKAILKGSVTFNDTAYTATVIGGVADPIVTANDIEITAVGKGVIIKSPNGTRWRLTPSNAGASVWTSL